MNLRTDVYNYAAYVLSHSGGAENVLLIRKETGKKRRTKMKHAHV